MPPVVNIAVAQFRPRKGDYKGNLARVGELFARLDADRPRPGVIVLPETALTGYFLEGGVRDHALTAGTLARDLDAAYRAAVTGPRTLDVALGFYEVWNNKLYNSAMYVTLGRGAPQIRHVHRKVFLPTYGLFDEERFVERGREVRAFETSWGRAAMLVCEDAWHSMTATIAALDGAQVLFVPAAPPARGMWPRQDDVPGPGSVSRWDRLTRDIADEHGVYVALTNLVGSEGGKVFPGSSALIGPKGDVRGRAPLWDEAILSVTIDLADVGRARADAPLIADLETMAPHLRATMERIEAGTKSVLSYDAAPVDDCPDDDRAGPMGATRSLGGAGFTIVRVEPSRENEPEPLAIDAALTERWLEGFIPEELEQRGIARVIVGISGGVDSAVTAFLAARALGPARVIGVRMPYSTSSKESLAHAQLVIDALGIEARTIDITAAVDGYLAHEPEAEPARR